MAQNYDRDKSFAILSGILAFLIVLAGTILGSYDAVSRLSLVGLLPVGCYLIADMVNIWAIYIDYKEDGTALEWASWATKAILSLYLLFIGGLVAYQLGQQKDRGQEKENRLEAYQRVYNDCIERTPQALVTCRKLAESQQATESKLAGKEMDERRVSSQAYDKLLEWPLFHYTPGLLGFTLFVLLQFVKKVSRKLTEASVSLPEVSLKRFDNSEAYRSFGKLTQNESKAYLSLPKASQAETYFSKDGEHFLKLIPQASGFQVRSEKNSYKGHIGWKAYDKLKNRGITYEKIINKLRGNEIN